MPPRPAGEALQGELRLPGTDRAGAAGLQCGVFFSWEERSDQLSSPHFGPLALHGLGTF